MATGNIILRIGSAMGPGGLASLQAGLTMVRGLGRAAINTVKEFDKFAKVLETVDMKMVNYADSAAQGQINTFDLMKQLQKIQHAFQETGIEITSEQFKILAVRATELAQKTGKDATQAFITLTDSIAKGTTRGLKEYGVYLSESTDLSKTHTQAIKLMTEGHEDLAVQLTTGSEKLYQLRNNWGTFISLLYSEKSAGAFKNVTNALTGMSGLLAEINERLSSGKDKANDYFFSLQGLSDWFWDEDKFRQNLQFLEQSDTRANIWKAEIEAMKAQREVLEQPLEAFMDEPAKKKKKKRRGGGGGGDMDDLPTYEEAEYEVNMLAVQKEREYWDAQYGDDRAVVARQQNAARLAQYEKEEKERLKEEERYAEHRAKFQQRLAAQSYSSRAGLEGYYDTTSGMIAQSGLDTADVYSMESQAIAQLDQQIERGQTLEDQRQEHFDAWLERIGEERIWRLEQLQFASDFKQVWRDALDGVSAGSMAAQASMDLMRGTWNAAIENAITGQNTFRSAIKNMLKDLGMAIAKEAGWRAAMNAALAIYAAAMRQYGKAAKHAAAAVAFTALAASAGAASAAMHRNTAVSGSAGASTAPAAGGSSVPQYGSTYPAGGSTQRQETVLHVYLDGKQIHTSVMREDRAKMRAGFDSMSGAA